MTTKLVEFACRLVATFPEVRPAFEEHVKDNFGEVLPHLFMADVARMAVSTLIETQGGSSGNTTERRQWLERLLAWFCREYDTGGEEVEELLSVSFLELLPRPPEEGSQIRQLIRGRMKEQLDLIG